MKSSRWSLAAAGLCVLFTGALLLAQEARRTRATLPAGYGKLGLSEEQKQAVYKIRNKYRDQIDDLKAQIKKLEQTERKEMETVLTPAQKARYRELKLGDLPEENAKKPDKK